MKDYIISVETARELALKQIISNMNNPMYKEYYADYMEKINKHIYDSIHSGYISFILEGDRGQLPGPIEALLLLKGYQIRRKDDNSFYVNFVDINNTYRNL
jgi:hypothetical protein